MNPAAPHHLPIFVTAPGQTDVLFSVMAIFLVVVVVALLVFYCRLHALPERLAHKGQKLQLEIVAVLGLISLFTHNHFFWIAGLLLAMVPIPGLLPRRWRVWPTPSRRWLADGSPFRTLTSLWSQRVRTPRRTADRA